MIVLLIWILFGKSEAWCESAQKACSTETECSGALHSYMMNCGDFMVGRSLHCTELCKKSVSHLTSLEMGKSFLDCDCRHDDDFCKLSKKTMTACTNSNKAKDCGEASWVCASDYNCSRALGYYRSHCASVMHLGTCSDTCNQSLKTLRQLDKANEMFLCECQGVEDYPCHQTVTETCRGKWSTVTPEAVQSDAPRYVFRWIVILGFLVQPLLFLWLIMYSIIF